MQEIAVNTFENFKGKVIYGLPVLLVNPHCLLDPKGDIKCAVETHIPITKSGSC